MLEEYKKQIYEIFDKYYNNDINMSKLAYEYNRLNNIWNFTRA